MGALQSLAARPGYMSPHDLDDLCDELREWSTWCRDPRPLADAVEVIRAASQTEPDVLRHAFKEALDGMVCALIMLTHEASPASPPTKRKRPTLRAIPSNSRP